VDKLRDCRLFVNVLKQVKDSHFIARQLNSYLLHFKGRNCQTQSVIILRENSAGLRSDLRRIQYRLFSLCEIFSFAALPTYPFTSTQLQQSLNYTCSSQPTGHERISRTNVLWGLRMSCRLMAVQQQDV